VVGADNLWSGKPIPHASREGFGTIFVGTTDCLLVFWRGLLSALRFFGADNPRRGNLHQYRLVLFRRSLRQTLTFCRILAKAACIIFHDTSVRLFQCCELQTGNSKFRSGSNQLPQWEPSQASGR
jgi:hypothetical protein